MSVVLEKGGLVVSAAQPIGLGTLVHVTAAANDPAYLVLNAFDRDEYTGAASGVTGRLSGGGSSLGLAISDGDAREAGIVFQYQSATGRYYSPTFGYLDQLTYTASSSLGDVTDLSLFGTSGLRFANAHAGDAIGLAALDPAGFLGSVTVATEPGASPAAGQATPDRVGQIADSFVGQSWNMDGCWVLASTIAAEAGASLPLQSTADLPGVANGEWMVAYDGSAGSTGDWRAMVTEGDVVGFVTPSGTGHITTAVSGSGDSAMLVDNETLVDEAGHILNAAGDGSANDVLIEAPHPAMDEWAGVEASSVVIYRLDTPVMRASAAALQVASGTGAGLAGLFSASDPAAKAVSAYQVYGQGASLLIDGVATEAADAASAATVGSLSRASLAFGAAGVDQVSVRAFNGTYWGDWASLAVDVAGPVPVAGAEPSPSAASSAAGPSPSPAAAPAVPVYRFFASGNGTHFFTASASERDSLIAADPGMVYEGVGMNAVAPSAGAAPVYRFFDQTDGTHFFTASAAERDSTMAARPDLRFEGTAFDEDGTPQAGDTAVYRFFDTLHGTHFYTQSGPERASLLAARPDLVPEGIAFYAPSLG